MQTDHQTDHHGTGPKFSLTVLEEDIEQALLYYRSAASKGYAKAQNNIGFLFFTGSASEDGHPDYAEAFNWFSKAAAQGSASSLYNIGLCYESGFGVLRNETLALQYFQQAADSGHLEARSSLGFLLLRRGEHGMYSCFSNCPIFDKGVITISNKGFTMYLLSCIFPDNSKLTKSLTCLFSSSSQLLPIVVRAAEHLRAAAEHNNPEALFYLGQMYENGLSVIACDRTAYQYYSWSAEQNHPMGLLKVADFLFSGRGMKVLIFVV